MTSYVILQRAEPRHFLVKALVQSPDGNGGWVTARTHQLDEWPLVEQVHGGQRIVIEEINPNDRRVPVQRLELRESPK